jgi:hypothetical protein
MDTLALQVDILRQHNTRDVINPQLLRLLRILRVSATVKCVYGFIILVLYLATQPTTPECSSIISPALVCLFVVLVLEVINGAYRDIFGIHQTHRVSLFFVIFAFLQLPLVVGLMLYIIRVVLPYYLICSTTLVIYLGLYVVLSLFLLVGYFCVRNVEQIQPARATRADHRSIRTTKIKTRSENVCSICLGAFEPREKISTLGCKHEYHHACIAEWMNRSRLCPLCKQVFSQARSTYSNQPIDV